MFVWKAISSMFLRISVISLLASVIAFILARSACICVAPVSADCRA